MGHANWGRQYYLRNIVYSRLSSFEIGLWQGFKCTFASMPRRVKSALAWYAPPAAIIYLTIDHMHKLNAASHRKNPKDFENDV